MMFASQCWQRATSVGAIATLQLGLSVAIVSQPAAAAKENPFGVCTEELLAVGFDNNTVAAACGRALLPDELSLCVISIVQDANVDAAFALDNCFRVRRPDELAVCALEIDEAFMLEDPTAVVDSCRRSILPLRFSDCVTGVGLGADVTVDTALKNCLAADNNQL
ncbi:MAG: hypothetical protein AAFY11_06345 [Cyanobacteria bacterium J06641_5]